MSDMKMWRTPKLWRRTTLGANECWGEQKHRAGFRAQIDVHNSFLCADILDEVFPIPDSARAIILCVSRRPHAQSVAVQYKASGYIEPTEGRYDYTIDAGALLSDRLHGWAAFRGITYGTYHVSIDIME